MLALLSMLGAATVGLSIEGTRGVSGAEAQAIAEGLGSALEARAGTVRLDDGPECPASPRCFAALRRRTGAGPLVYVRLVGVPTRIRVLLTFVPAGQEQASSNESVDLNRNQATWPRVFERIAKTFLPQGEPPPPPPPPSVVEAPPPPPPVVEAAPPPPNIEPPVVERKSSPSDDTGAGVGPWILGGVGVAALATGIGFGASSRSARNEASSMPVTPAELRVLEDRAIDHGVIANVAFGAAIVAVGGAIVWWIVD